VNDCAILNIDLIADFYEMYVATDYRIKPNTARMSKSYIANDGSIFGNITIVGNIWRFAIDRFDQHN
jgi:hypothetical protein